MASHRRIAQLRVEGIDDLHSIRHLLEKHGHGAEYDQTMRAFHVRSGPIIGDAKSLDALLQELTDAVPLSVETPIGFVIDADADPAARWQSIADRLRSHGASPPSTIPVEGLILEVAKFKTTVGVWLMPDNRSHGAIEDFLRSLIADDDRLIAHADTATEQATSLGARFRPVHRQKAVVHTWLAWQDEPGKPFGVAIKAEFFKHDRQAAADFVAWFRKLYGLAPDSSALSG